MNWRVRLSQSELMLASYVGSGRNVQAITNGWPPVAGQSLANSWTMNIEGAAGERATAKRLGVYYEPIIGNTQADDVGPYQVRTNCSRKYDDTCLRGRDKPDRVYISVLSFCPDYELIGWIWGFDGKRDEWLRPGDPGRPPCFYVPRSALRPMEELPSIAELETAQMDQFARETLN